MFVIDKLSREPIYEQVIWQICRMIQTGLLAPGDQIPSVRALSEQLGVNPNTLQRAYNELESRGITTGVVGVGRFVSEKAVEKLQQQNAVFLTDFSQMVERLKSLGIPQQQVNQIIENIYKDGQKGVYEK